MLVRTLMASLVVAALSATLVPAALAGDPALVEQTIANVGFETSGDIGSFDFVPTPGISKAYWGPTSYYPRTGLRSLWVAGTEHPSGLPSTREPNYPEDTVGSAYLKLPGLADYYSSRLSYWYECDSRGSVDDQFKLAIQSPDQSIEYRSEMLGDVPVWTSKSYDFSQFTTPISRDPVWVQFRFADSVEGGGIPQGDQHGPHIDDVVLTGWKYGPVRSVAASKVGSNFRTTWARPYNSLNETVDDARTLAYRVWRAPAGTGTWTEVSPPERLGDSALRLDDPIISEGVAYDYLVQAWDPGTGSGYGQWTKTASSVSAPAANPEVAITAPAARYSLDAGPVTISGTSSDTGSGVSSVKVRIQRTGDNKYWSGSGDVWTDVETWVPTTGSNGWATWSIQWTPDAATIDADEIVYVTARATDVSGRTAYTQPVPSIATAAISVAGDVDFTNQSTNVPVDIIAKVPPSYVRFRVNGVNQGGFVDYSDSLPVDLPGGEGLKTVECDWSNDGVNPSRTVTDTIILETGLPSVTVTSPAANFTPGTTTSAGTASDAAAGLESVHLVISSLNYDGTTWYWTGLEWSTSSQELEASANGSDWTYGSVPAAPKWLYGPMRIQAIARDHAGNERTASVSSVDRLDPVTLTVSQNNPTPAYGSYSRITGKLTSEGRTMSGKRVYLRYYNSTANIASALTGSDGSVSFNVYPKNKTAYRLYFPPTPPYEAKYSSTNVTVNPKVYLSTPKRPSSARKNRSFPTYGYVKPLHTSVSSYSSRSPVRVLAYRWDGKTYVLKKTFYTKLSRSSSTTSKYVASVKLPYTGKWKLRAYAPTDSKHYATWGSYTSYFNVK